MVKALALLSGGLDSTLAAKVVLEQGVQVEGGFFVHAFFSNPSKEGVREEQAKSQFTLQKKVAAQLGIKLHFWDISEAHLKLVQAPRYGYGENMNPCIDCHIFMLNQALGYMRKENFSFLISGEVLGQRPMSQRRAALDIVEREAQVQGILLRPLSAKLLKPSLAEEKGWVDREKLFAFSGRSRKAQLALAEKLNISVYSTPAGGCLLTEKEFCRKLRDLLQSRQFSLSDVHLLKLGRHFRFNETTKIIVGRDDQENQALMALAGASDILLRLRDFAGPLTVIREGSAFASNGVIEAAARLTARYSKGKEEKKVWVDFWQKGPSVKESVLVSPAQEDLIKGMRI